MIINEKSQTDLSGFYVVFNTTIKNEHKGIRGISHLIEHIMCNNYNDLLDNFEKFGINWNAYTSDSQIVFYITGLDDYMNRYKDIFLDKLLTLNINENILQKEKKIIFEEYTNSFNKQNTSHYLNLYRKLFNNYNPIGDINDIKNISIDDVKKHYNMYYNNPSKIINISKKSPYDNKIDFNNLSNDYNINYIKNNDFLYENTNYYKTKTSLIYLSPIINNDYPYIKFITTLLGNGLKSPLYHYLREKLTLVYHINCYLDIMTNNSAVINISTETNHDNVDILNFKIKELLENKELFLTEERYDTVKESYKIHSKKSEIFRYKNINKYLSPKEWLVDNIIDDLTFDEINYYYDKYFNFDNFYISLDNNEFL